MPTVRGSSVESVIVPPDTARFVARHGSPKGPLQIGPEIVDGFDADRQPHQRRIDLLAARAYLERAGTSGSTSAGTRQTTV
jgi:hypothetical protein